MDDTLVDRLRELQTRINEQQKSISAALELLADSENQAERLELARRLEQLFESQGEALARDPDIKKLLLDGVLSATPLGKWGVVAQILAGVLGKVKEPSAGDGALSEIDDVLGGIFGAPSRAARTPSAGPREGSARPEPVTGAAPSGEKILDIAKRHLGQPYENIRIRYDDPNWKGPFDCAEYASYCAWHAYGILYGARIDAGSGEVPLGKNVEAWTNYWKADAHGKGIIVSVNEALETAGAFLLRYPPGDGRMGHIAICLGNGKDVYEAYSGKRGVIKNSAKGRRTWNIGIKLPGVDYGDGPEQAVGERIYRYVEPVPLYSEVVELIQKELNRRGLLAAKDIDGEFGPITRDAVLAFQRVQGLLEDGEVGPDTGAALGLDRIWEAEVEAQEDIEDEVPVVSAAVPAQLSRSKKFEDLKQEYEALYAAAKVRSNWRKRAEDVAARIVASKARYQGVAGQLGQVPWYLVGVIHSLESSLDFATHLHNGDPLTRRTGHVPAGRPRHKPRGGGTRYTWEESAIDALKMKDFHVMQDWPLARVLFRLEGYNGFGYRSRGVPTAYLWSGTQIYDRGKFVADGVWDANAVSQQVGAATLLKVLEEMGEARIG